MGKWEPRTWEGLGRLRPCLDHALKAYGHHALQALSGSAPLARVLGRLREGVACADAVALEVHRAARGDAGVETEWVARMARTAAAELPAVLAAGMRRHLEGMPLPLALLGGEREALLDARPGDGAALRAAFLDALAAHHREREARSSSEALRVEHLLALDAVRLAPRDHAAAMRALRRRLAGVSACVSLESLRGRLESLYPPHPVSLPAARAAPPA